MAKQRVSQSRLPWTTLEEALRVATAIHREFAGQPTAPLSLAQAVGIKPSSSNWRTLTGTAVAYGLTTGAYNTEAIGLTELGRRIVAPRREDGDERVAMAEAALNPSVPGDFARKYDQNKFPRDDIASTVLRDEFDVPADRIESTVRLIVENMRYADLLEEIQGDWYVNLARPEGARPAAATPPAAAAAADMAEMTDGKTDDTENDSSEGAFPRPPGQAALQRNVFVSHGDNRAVVEQVRQLLELGGFEPVIAVEQETEAIPVPEKVFSAMRQCAAAIICVTADQGEGPDDGGYFSVNENVLIEIGAAWVLYDRRVILLWDKRVRVPSNLQGLYRCEFEGEELSWTAGTKLQKALIAFKRGAAPDEA